MVTRKSSRTASGSTTKARGSTAGAKRTKAIPKPTVTPAAASRASDSTVPTESKAKHKLIRDSFTIPKNEYALIDALKQRAAKLDKPIKKSELLRAGIGALTMMGDQPLLAALSAVPSLKTGRPKLHKSPNHKSTHKHG